MGMVITGRRIDDMCVEVFWAAKAELQQRRMDGWCNVYLAWLVVGVKVRVKVCF